VGRANSLERRSRNVVYPARYLRVRCCCAVCVALVDVPADEDVHPVAINAIGGYAIQFRVERRACRGAVLVRLFARDLSLFDVRLLVRPVETRNIAADRRGRRRMGERADGDQAGACLGIRARRCGANAAGSLD